MAQIYNIYINETVLIITESVPDNIGQYESLDPHAFHPLTFYNKVKGSKAPGVYLVLTPNAKRLFKGLKKTLLLIEAAGGLVENDENQYLFIFRRGKWDLPKGKIDEGEKTEAAAVREVEEECGIEIGKVEGKICKTWHIYEQNHQVILKKTTWYKMRAKTQELVPQTEEDITEARWLAEKDFSLVRANTFPLILDVITTIEAR